MNRNEGDSATRSSGWPGWLDMGCRSRLTVTDRLDAPQHVRRWWRCRRRCGVASYGVSEQFARRASHGDVVDFTVSVPFISRQWPGNVQT